MSYGNFTSLEYIVGLHKEDRNNSEQVKFSTQSAPSQQPMNTINVVRFFSQQQISGYKVENYLFNWVNTSYIFIQLKVSIS